MKLTNRIVSKVSESLKNAIADFWIFVVMQISEKASKKDAKRFLIICYQIIDGPLEESTDATKNVWDDVIVDGLKHGSLLAAKQLGISLEDVDGD